MEEYLIFAAIGGLLLLTMLVNSVSEAYEQKQREKRIKILKIKQGIDELGDLLSNLKRCDISDSISNFLSNEIMARLQTIQMLDKHFRGIEALLEEAKAVEQSSPVDNKSFIVKDETDFKKKLVILGRLIRILNSYRWYSNVKAEQLRQYIEDTKLLRCEKIFQFYTDKASEDTTKKRYMIAKEHYYYILHALKGSGINHNPRVVELMEQAEFMLQQTGKMATENHKQLLAERDELEDAQAEQENSEPIMDKPENNKDSQPQTETKAENDTTVNK